MAMLALSKQELSLLRKFNFSQSLQEELRKRYLRGELSKEANRLSHGVTLPPENSVLSLPAPETTPMAEAIEAGAGAVHEGKVGLLILNGGMATRFGGVVKGAVPVVGDLSFLGLKLTAARLLSKRLGGEISIFLMNSLATHEKTVAHLRENNYFGYPPDLVTCFLQNTLLRLTPDGNLFRHDDGALSPFGPGHGDVAEALRRGPLSDLCGRGISILHMSNVDNVLATPDPLILGLHLLNSSEMTIEVVRNRGNDVGGAPAIVEGKLQIVEAFRFPEGFPVDRLGYFNTNTFCFSPSSLDRSFPLNWFMVTKHVEGRKAIQFERLAGQLSAFLSCTIVAVERDGSGSRFSPIKDRPTLDRERERIVRTLIAREFLPMIVQE